MNKKDIPKGANEVIGEVKGYLYVDMGKNAVKVKNTLNSDSTPDYVYIKDSIDGYEMSLQPFPTAKKRNTATKKK